MLTFTACLCIDGVLCCKHIAEAGQCSLGWLPMCGPSSSTFRVGLQLHATIPLPHLYPKELKSPYQRPICTPMLSEALIAIGKSGDFKIRKLLLHVSCLYARVSMCVLGTALSMEVGGKLPGVGSRLYL